MTLNAAITVLDQAGGETSAEGILKVSTDGVDAGSVGLWIGHDDRAGIVISDLNALKVALAAL